MSDQQPKQNVQALNRSSSSGVADATGGGGGVNDNRPGSARSNRERHERVILLKERQNSERVKKLEELKEQVGRQLRLNCVVDKVTKHSCSCVGPCSSPPPRRAGLKTQKTL